MKKLQRQNYIVLVDEYSDIAYISIHNKKAYNQHKVSCYINSDCKPEDVEKEIKNLIKIVKNEIVIQH